MRQDPILSDPRWSFVREHAQHVRAWLTTLSELLGETPLQEASANCSSDPSSGSAIDSEERPHQTHQSMEGPGEESGNDIHPALDQVLDERLRQRTIFDRFERFSEIFPPRQWAAICLRYRDGLSEEQIGQRLHVGRTAINNRLRRAWLLLDQREQRLRAEAFRLARPDVDS